MNRLRTFHRLAGLAALAVFLLTGAYMRFRVHPQGLSDGAHMMYVSRHIYILANALAHLALASYAVPRPGAAGRAAQWTGSALLALSSALLFSAFALEPVAGRGRTFTSTYGLYLLLAGVLLHFLSGAGSKARG